MIVMTFGTPQALTTLDLARRDPAAIPPDSLP
jgi:hypothetical protein